MLRTRQLDEIHVSTPAELRELKYQGILVVCSADNSSQNMMSQGADREITFSSVTEVKPPSSGSGNNDATTVHPNIAMASAHDLPFSILHGDIAPQTYNSGSAEDLTNGGSPCSTPGEERTVPVSWH